MTSRSSSPRARFGIRFSLLARRWRKALDERLAEAGLSDATWAPLIHLQETGGGVTQKELAALVGIDGSGRGAFVDPRGGGGLAERRGGEGDGGGRLISPTADGEQRVAAIRRELAKGEEEMLADITDADLAAMLRHFDRIEERLSAMQARRREEKSR